MNSMQPRAQRSAHFDEPSSPWAQPFRHIGAAVRAPLQNRILATLPPEDFQRLLPVLEPFPMPRGWTVHDAGRPQTHLYFITQGVVSRVCLTKDGRSAEFTTTGREGVVGVTLCLGGASTSSQAEVVVEGFAFRLEADLLMRELGKHGQLFELLLGHVQCVMAESGQIAACNRLHPLQNRLCRWLLSLLDRVSDTQLPLTHDVIANLLGVRREGVTYEAGKLQQEGLICCHRGHLDVLDRRGLEARACECYPIIRRVHDHLGKGSPMPLPVPGTPYFSTGNRSQVA